MIKKEKYEINNAFAIYIWKCVSCLSKSKYQKFPLTSYIYGVEPYIQF